MRKPTFEIAQIVSGATSGRPYFLLETNLTSDGPRTRICNGRWRDWNEADAERTRRQEEAGK